MGGIWWSWWGGAGDYSGGGDVLYSTCSTRFVGVGVYRWIDLLID